MSNNAFVIPYIWTANAIPEIVADFGQSIAIHWIPLAFNLCFSVSLMLFGRLADIFGRRYFVLGAFVLSIVGSIVGATAHNARVLVGAQVLLGISGAVQGNTTIWVAERRFT